MFLLIIDVQYNYGVFYPIMIRVIIKQKEKYLDIYRGDAETESIRRGQAGASYI